MVLAIEYCHSQPQKIIHRDIKPENILLDKEGHVRLADFGWSQFFSEADGKRKTFAGTLYYLAPEMILKSGHDETLDYWCLGALIYELLSGIAPFTPSKNVSHDQLQKTIMDNILV
jgi:serine/threonine protein kinase